MLPSPLARGWGRGEAQAGKKKIPPKSSTWEAAEGSLYLIWGRVRALCAADRGCPWSGLSPSALRDRVRAFLTPRSMAPPLCENVLCLKLSFVIASGVRGRKAQPGGAGDSARTFWKRGGASRRLQLRRSPAGAAGKFRRGLPIADWSLEQKMLQGSYSMCFNVLRTILLFRYSSITQ